MANHKELSGYQAFLLDRINVNTDADGWCRLTNNELAAKTGTTRKRVVVGIGVLVESHCLIRSRDTNTKGRVTERRLHAVRQS